MQNAVLEKLQIRETDGAIRSVQATREWIQSKPDRLKAANTIVTELGGKPLGDNYSARIVAQNMVSDLVLQGAEFDGETSYAHGVKRAEVMSKQYPYFAKQENGVIMETVNVEVTANGKAKIVKISKPKEAGKRGSRRAQVKELILKNQGKKMSEIIKVLMETLNIGKPNATTQYYLAKKELQG